MCDNLFNVSNALAKQKRNPLNKWCVSCYLKSNKETSVSNELETVNNSKMIVEGDKEIKSKNNNTKNREDVPEEVSCTFHMLSTMFISTSMMIYIFLILRTQMVL